MKLTQREIAKQIGITDRHLCAVLRGQTRPSVKLAKLLEPYTGKPWTAWFEDSGEPAQKACPEKERS